MNDSVPESGNKTANINVKNYRLHLMLTATDHKPQNHKKVILLSITLTLRQRDDG